MAPARGEEQLVGVEGGAQAQEGLPFGVGGAGLSGAEAGGHVLGPVEAGGEGGDVGGEAGGEEAADGLVGDAGQDRQGPAAGLELRAQAAGIGGAAEPVPGSCPKRQPAATLTCRRRASRRPMGDRSRRFVRSVRLDVRSPPVDRRKIGARAPGAPVRAAS